MSDQAQQHATDLRQLRDTTTTPDHYDVDIMSIKSYTHSLMLRASPARAILEALLFNLVLAVCVMFLDVSIGVKRQSIIFVVLPIGALWYALRARLPVGTRLHQACVECGLIVALSAVLLIVPALFAPAMQFVIQPGNVVLSVLAGAVVAVTYIMFAATALRGGMRLWLIWDRWRRQRLVWALTHAHLTVVVIIALVIVVVVTIIRALTATELPLTREYASPMVSLLASFITGTLPIVGFLVILTVFALAAVLPPSAMVSYWFARRTTRRLDSLTRATSALRSGDTSARVTVEGEDEVAHLQTDFNTMAGELERTLTELRIERDKVAALLASRRQLVASVSHELRTPVATVCGYLESILTHTSELPESVERDLNTMEQEMLRLQNLIEDLFALSRADAGGLALQIHAGNVSDVVQRCVATAAPLAMLSSHVTVTSQLPENLPLALFDEVRLPQIINNLLRNAIQHTPPGGIVAIKATTEPGAVLLQVKDTGPGISADDLPHIWERFYRGQMAYGEGTGLGLAIVKELTQAMNGTVTVDSATGLGSCFNVRIPLAPV